MLHTDAATSRSMQNAPQRRDERLESATARARTAARMWWTRASDGSRGAARHMHGASNTWLLGVPDVGPACEILLADALFHDLEDEERDGLARWIRSRHDPSTGAWLGLDGAPDLSLTALGWMALRQAGDASEAEHMGAAKRAVLELGGAQRASFCVRLWLAMSGAAPWSWLPAIPHELWLLPRYAPLSPHRIASWAREVITPYHVLASAPAHLQLVDASSLLLRDHQGKAIPPRLTSPGLAGDLLQAFDRTIKLSRKLPRSAMHGRAATVARRWVMESQQDHGGWFSVRPTLYALLALRVTGSTSDAPEIERGLAYLRRARGRVGTATDGLPLLAQGLGTVPLGVAARLSTAADADDLRWLLVSEIDRTGPWQSRADAEAGGWPLEPGAAMHLDLAATCAAVECLRRQSAKQPERATGFWPAIRRAADVMLAMQEPDGSFARFERGETTPFLAQLPWRDADQLAHGELEDEARVALTAEVVRQLGHLGWRREDDRIARAVDWMKGRFDRDLTRWQLPTLCAVGRAAALQCAPDHPLRRATERALRRRQAEDGSFGTAAHTALALQALLDLDGACVQAQRAARALIDAVESSSSADLLGLDPLTIPGFGLSPVVCDPSAGAREVCLALTRYAELGGAL